MKIYPYQDTDGHPVQIVEQTQDRALVEYEDGIRKWLWVSQVTLRLKEVIR